jgi:capsular polysaccharide biosynthesis protein
MAKEHKKQGFVYDAFDLISFTWEKKWILIALSLLAFVISIIVSLKITPRFRSSVIMFPAASVSVSKNLVETSVITSDTKDILTFGEVEEAERLLQVLQSDQVRQHIIEKFNLMQHYEIDTTKNKYPYTTLNNKFKGNVKIHRTEFSSIQIEVLDEDPQMAADIANDISAFVDSVFFNIKKGRAKEAYSIVERECNISKITIESMSDSLKAIRMLGIQDYETQAEALNKAYADALSANNTNAIKVIENKMNIMAKYGGIYVELSDKLEWEIERFSLLKTKLAAAKVNLENTMSNVFIVDKATKSERKAIPKRSIIVIMSTLSTFALALLILLVIDNIKARS